MWRLLIVLLGVVGGMDQRKFKNQMTRYLFQHHKTIERLRPLLGKSSNHDKNRKLFESTKAQNEELNLKIEHALVLYEVSDLYEKNL